MPDVSVCLDNKPATGSKDKLVVSFSSFVLSSLSPVAPFDSVEGDAMHSVLSCGLAGGWSLSHVFASFVIIPVISKPLLSCPITSVFPWYDVISPASSLLLFDDATSFSLGASLEVLLG